MKSASSRDDPRPRKYRASLLDRLICDDPEGRPERPPKARQARVEFERSLLRDLERLLNSRSTSVETLGRGERPSVLDYGVRDFTALTPGFNEDRHKLSGWLKDAIVGFEPRLKIRRVEVEPVEGEPRRLAAWFEADLLADEVNERVSFRILADTSTGEIALNGRGSR